MAVALRVRGEELLPADPPRADVAGDLVALRTQNTQKGPRAVSWHPVRKLELQEVQVPRYDSIRLRGDRAGEDGCVAWITHRSAPSSDFVNIPLPRDELTSGKDVTQHGHPRPQEWVVRKSPFDDPIDFIDHVFRKNQPNVPTEEFEEQLSLIAAEEKS